jgi:hypothetical protein
MVSVKHSFYLIFFVFMQSKAIRFPLQILTHSSGTRYKKAAQEDNRQNEFTKTFCDTEQYKTSKKITEVTRDSIYQKGKQDMIKTHQGFQSLDISKIPSFQQHEANQKQLSKQAYSEDWNLEKDAVYFPAHATEGYNK